MLIPPFMRRFSHHILRKECGAYPPTRGRGKDAAGPSARLPSDKLLPPQPWNRAAQHLSRQGLGAPYRLKPTATHVMLKRAAGKPVKECRLRRCLVEEGFGTPLREQLDSRPSSLFRSLLRTVWRTPILIFTVRLPPFRVLMIFFPPHNMGPFCTAPDHIRHIVA